MTVSYETIREDSIIQVFIDDYYAGDLIKLGEPSEPDPQGRMFIGPWAFDGKGATVMAGWPAIREIAMEIERRNTHWNWTLKNKS